MSTVSKSSRETFSPFRIPDVLNMKQRRYPRSCVALQPPPPPPSAIHCDVIRDQSPKRPSTFPAWGVKQKYTCRQRHRPTTAPPPPPPPPPPLPPPPTAKNHNNQYCSYRYSSIQHTSHNIKRRLLYAPLDWYVSKVIEAVGKRGGFP